MVAFGASRKLVAPRAGKVRECCQLDEICQCLMQAAHVCGRRFTGWNWYTILSPERRTALKRLLDRAPMGRKEFTWMRRLA